MYYVTLIDTNAIIIMSLHYRDLHSVTQDRLSRGTPLKPSMLLLSAATLLP